MSSGAGAAPKQGGSETLLVRILSIHILVLYMTLVSYPAY